MPLDALCGTIGADSLAVVLDQRELKPVDRNTLAAHKQAQLRKFGPTFWYRHQALLGLTLIGSIGFMALTAGAANAAMPSSPVSLWNSKAWQGLVAALTISGVFRARAGSHWEERRLPIDLLETSGVPLPIAAMARSISREIPDATVILGELIRESIVL
ncbi:MAG: hypothetical protein QOG25_3574, partial [Acetobacteraceae bacterium]|nr:hypothetical protein [Acetobacteraceae bacterium]